jgi:hypothetical protein
VLDCDRISTVNFEERVLYHQIHPLKLATDWLTAFGAASLFWQHRPGLAVLLVFMPSVVVSIVLVGWVDLERYRNSSFGRYVRRYMGRRVEAARFLGLTPFWGGAWAHRPMVMIAGVLWILGCWVWGLRDRAYSRDTA